LTRKHVQIIRYMIAVFDFYVVQHIVFIAQRRHKRVDANAYQDKGTFWTYHILGYPGVIPLAVDVASGITPGYPRMDIPPLLKLVAKDISYNSGDFGLIP